MDNNTVNWKVNDKYEGIDLTEIASYAEKANSFFARNKDHKALNNNFIEIAGAINIMRALEYHFKRYMSFNSGLLKSNEFKNRQIPLQLLEKSSENLFGMQNELVAYINRLGQFYYFAKSEFIKGINSNALSMIPKIKELSIFRMKNTAHRSIDVPRGESYVIQLYQAYSLMGGYSRNSHGHVSFQIPNKVKPNGDMEIPSFITLETDHEIIMKEAYNLINSLTN